MQLTRFEALGLLPPRAKSFDLYAKLPDAQHCRARLKWQKYKTLSMEGLLNWLNTHSPVNLVYLSDTKRPYLKFQNATYLKVDKRKLRKFVLENPTGYFEVN